MTSRKAGGEGYEGVLSPPSGSGLNQVQLGDAETESQRNNPLFATCTPKQQSDADKPANVFADSETISSRNANDEDITRLQHKTPTETRLLPDTGEPLPSYDTISSHPTEPPSETTLSPLFLKCARSTLKEDIELNQISKCLSEESLTFKEADEGDHLFVSFFLFHSLIFYLPYNCFVNKS